jgi:hypothetical protein
MNSNKISSNYTVMVCVFIAHLPLLLLPAINLEFAFADAAQYFVSHNKVLLDQYFAYEANPLVLSWLAGQIAILFPSISLLTILRLISISGIFFLAIGIQRTSIYLEERINAGFVAVLLLNPLVWTYSGRGTADLFPAAIGCFAISVVLEEKVKIGKIITAGILLGIAAILKYHELGMSLLLAALLLHKYRGKDFWIIILTVTGIASCILFIYLFAVKINYGFWVTPEKFQKTHGINIGGIGNNFMAYVGYLVMLAAPFSLVLPGGRPFLKKYGKLLLPIALIIFMAGAYGIKDNGEMNLGPLDRWIPTPLATGTFTLLFFIYAVPFFKNPLNIISADRTKNLIRLALLAIIFILSTSRPAQRYLLLILPVFLLTLPRSGLRSKILLPVTLMFFGCVGAFINYSQWCTGTAAKKMVGAIETAGYLNETNPGAINGHEGNRFFQVEQSHIRFIVRPGIVKGAIITVKSGFSFAPKAYSLVKLNDREPT